MNSVSCLEKKNHPDKRKNAEENEGDGEYCRYVSTYVCFFGRENTKKYRQQKKTYNTGDSLVVTDPTTNPALSGLTRGERTGSRAFQMVWSYVMILAPFQRYICDSW